jgi:hypothetical protein
MRKFALERSISNLGMGVESQRGCSAVAAVSVAADFQWGCNGQLARMRADRRGRDPSPSLAAM